MTLFVIAPVTHLELFPNSILRRDEPTTQILISHSREPEKRQGTHLLKAKGARRKKP
jgi:hypothetical protein